MRFVFILAAFFLNQSPAFAQDPHQVIDEAALKEGYREATAEEKTAILNQLDPAKLQSVAAEALIGHEDALKQIVPSAVFGPEPSATPTASPSANPSTSNSVDPIRLEQVKSNLNLMRVTVPQHFDLNTSADENGKPLFHEIYFSWGYNRAWHNRTDVEFRTQDGTFTIHDAVGEDRPSPFDPKVYFSPAKMSIPQYNMEIGVMFNSKWGIEIKEDHMKWVFDSQRPYTITGEYDRLVAVNNPNSVAGWDQVQMVPFSVAAQNKDATWLQFEHSDGYNYVAAGAVYNQSLSSSRDQRFKMDARFGAGAGMIIPKTKVMFHRDSPWNWEGLDNKFHIAGGGVHAEAKLRFTMFSRLYIQAAARGTYIKVKNALVDDSGARMEHIQPISSIQIMGQVGYTHPIGQKKKTKKIP